MLRRRVIIPAGGTGTRMNLGYPKQLLHLGGTTVIERIIQMFFGWADDIWVAVPASSFEVCAQVIGETAHVVAGGSTRFASVQAAFHAIPDVADDDLIIIHDAARPFFEPETLNRACDLAQTRGAVIYASPATDTVKQVDAHGQIEKTLDRSTIFLAQTPQIFRAGILKAAYATWTDDGHPPTDEAALIESTGTPVTVFRSSKTNIKLTEQEDLALIPRPPRIGHGYDVHAFQAGRPLYLGGIHVPHELGLAGHSDADVALHALIDALLGAAGLGDIGQWFPDTDPAYTDIRSTELLQQVWQTVHARGYDLCNADLTIQAQIPKLAPHLDDMRRMIATLLLIDPTCINIKATTTEGLGFVGRKEGIAAHAVVLIQHTKGVVP